MGDCHNCHYLNRELEEYDVLMKSRFWRVICLRRDLLDFIINKDPLENALFCINELKKVVEAELNKEA